MSPDRPRGAKISKIFQGLNERRGCPLACLASQSPRTSEAGSRFESGHPDSEMWCGGPRQMLRGPTRTGTSPSSTLIRGQARIGVF